MDREAPGACSTTLATGLGPRRPKYQRAHSTDILGSFPGEMIPVDRCSEHAKRIPDYEHRWASRTRIVPASEITK